MGYHPLVSSRADMISPKLSLVVCWLATVGLEAKPAPALPVGTYSYTSQMGSNSIDQAPQPAAATRTTSRGRVVAEDFRSYLPIEDTPEVQEAKEKFFDAFKQQTDLINEVREDGLWSAQPYADYYEDFEEAALGEYEYGDEEEDEEGDGGEEEDEEDDDDDDDDDEDDEDSDEDSSSSSSSSEESDEDEEDSDEEDDEEDEDEEDEDEDEEDEDDDDEDEEDDDDDDEEDSDEDDEEDSSSSSEEDDYGDDSSSSSSSSSSSEEDGEDPALLSMKALQALQPQQVEDTPEVEAAKRKFFDAYKTQIELVSNDI